ncbi:MAG TPA: DUF3078 domain-containing protein [bacterium]|nr:DUF3078 domain-containing protein [bacterium]
MLKKITLIFLLIPVIIFTQTTELEDKLKQKKKDIPMGLNRGGVITTNLSQTSLNNWASGGNNSLAINGIVNLFLNYRKEKSIWNNTADIGYGLLKQGKDADFIKTDDRLELNSKYGYRAHENWYYSGMMNFVTQMAKGFDYENDTSKISAPFAPAYLTGAIGMDYQQNDTYSIFLSPLTTKMTFVIDDELSEQGEFGVEKGSKFRMEIGGYLKTNLRKEILKNVIINSNLSLFSNYIDNPQNIDIDWKILLTMKVNQYISTNITTHMIYDDDITIIDEETGEKNGPALQLKEVIGVGISYSF